MAVAGFCHHHALEIGKGRDQEKQRDREQLSIEVHCQISEQRGTDNEGSANPNLASRSRVMNASAPAKNSP